MKTQVTRIQKATPQTPSATEQEILYFFYRFRFLTTYHIQQLLNHNNLRYAQRLLKHLQDKNYLFAFYDPTTLLGRKTFAVYCLATKARVVLSSSTKCDAVFLAHLYREKTRSVTFRTHCLLLADIYFLFSKQAQKEQKVLQFFTKTELLEYTDFPTPLPDAYLVLTSKKGTTERFLIRIIDPKTPWFAITALVQSYTAYFAANTWQNQLHSINPTLLVIVSDKRSIRYLKKALRIQQETEYVEQLHWWYTTKELLLQKGIHYTSWQNSDTLQ